MGALLKKEIKLLWSNPLTYILVVVVVVFSEWFYFRGLFAVPTASMESIFRLLQWVLIVAVPALSMGLISEERKSGTIDILLSKPISVWRVVLAKSLSVLTVIFTMFVFTVLIPIFLSSYGGFDFGQIVASYIGAGLFSVGLVAIGVFASSVSKNQFGSFLLAVAIMFILTSVGSDGVLLTVSGVFRDILEAISLSGHFGNMLNGVIRLSDAVYFVSLTFVFAFWAWFNLEKHIDGLKSKRVKRLFFNALLITVLAIVLNMLLAFSGAQLDLTKGKKYTLSPSAVTLLKGLDKDLEVKVYYSKVLPREMLEKRNGVFALVKNIARKSPKLSAVFVEISPEDMSDDLSDEILRYGVRPVNFNIVNRSGLNFSSGYLGIVVRDKESDLNKAVPFVESLDDLEFTLLTNIRSVNGFTRKKLGLMEFFDSEGLEPLESRKGIFERYLGDNYILEGINFAEGGEYSPDDYDAIIVLDPDRDLNDEEAEFLNAVKDAGAGVLVLYDGVRESPNEGIVEFGESPKLEEFLSGAGVIPGADLVVSRSLSEVVLVPGQGGGGYFVNYGFWPIVKSLQSDILKGEYQFGMHWAQSFDLAGGVAGDRLLATAPDAVSGERFTVLEAGRDIVDGEPGVKFTAVATVADNGAKIAVAGDDAFITGEFSSGNVDSGAVAFFGDLTGWVSGDEIYSGIRPKPREPGYFSFTSEKDISRARLLVMSLSVLGLVLLFLYVKLSRLNFNRKRF